jgi:hypothetical protein
MARFAIVPGELVAERPLDLVQIDHTEVDVIVVDPEHRQSVRRPWLTLAIDVNSRMVVGYHLSLNEPSAVSVGLCLLNAVFDKTTLLADRDIDIAWPCAGLTLPCPIPPRRSPANFCRPGSNGSRQTIGSPWLTLPNTSDYPPLALE